MSIGGIEGIGGLAGAGFTPFQAPRIDGAGGAGGIGGTSGIGGPGGLGGTQGVAGGSSFSDLVLDGIDRLEGVQDKASTLGVQAATGQLDNIHDYTLAASQAQVTTQLTVAVRNKAVEAFTEIMRMPI
ncbi:MAG TPA: flagellar hook-basal body complex protein FliE [Nocardioides sp.]